MILRDRIPQKTLDTFKKKFVRFVTPHFPRSWLEFRIWRHDKHFEPEFWLVPRLVRPGTAAIDVGANEGHYAVFMAKSARVVHAFEPNPICIANLKKILPGNVVLHEAGASATPGKAMLQFDPCNTGLGTLSARNDISQNPDVTNVEKIEISTLRPDGLEETDVSFIKIDVEGFEEEVVAGCEGLLAQSRPRFLIEVEERHNPGGLSRLKQWFDARQYRGVFLRAGKLEPLENFKLSEDQVLNGPDPYINNFIFVHESDVRDVIGAG